MIKELKYLSHIKKMRKIVNKNKNFKQKKIKELIMAKKEKKELKHTHEDNLTKAKNHFLLVNQKIFKYILKLLKR